MSDRRKGGEKTARASLGAEARNIYSLNGCMWYSDRRKNRGRRAGDPGQTPEKDWYPSAYRRRSTDAGSFGIGTVSFGGTPLYPAYEPWYRGHYNAGIAANVWDQYYWTYYSEPIKFTSCEPPKTDGYIVQGYDPEPKRPRWYSSEATRNAHHEWMIRESTRKCEKRNKERREAAAKKDAARKKEIETLRVIYKREIALEEEQRLKTVKATSERMRHRRLAFDCLDEIHKLENECK